MASIDPVLHAVVLRAVVVVVTGGMDGRRAAVIKNKERIFMGSHLGVSERSSLTQAHQV
ncbi:hypothetical protein [Archangium violaceum]|uniref:hypothetical protein n=1 Tax=Archangium violaceum TaxID=83451 RepID=UPI0036DB91B2